MNLHKQYKTLMKRGMPEHPTLVWNCIDKDLGPIATLKVCFQKYPVTLKSMVNDAPDARDLLIMHALRWCREGGWHISINSDGGGGDWNCTMWQPEPTCKAGNDGIGDCGPTILEAIIATTEHLEPTNEPS